MTETTADLRARLAALWDRAHPGSAPPDQWPPITRLVTGDGLDRVPPGFAAWAVGRWPNDPDTAPAEGRHVIVLPELDPAAPYEVHRRYMARVIADGTGRCPMCAAVAGIVGPDPEHGHRAGFHRLPVVVGIQHATACPAEFTEDDRRWFPVHRGGGAA